MIDACSSLSRLRERAAWKVRTLFERPLSPPLRGDSLPQAGERNVYDTAERIRCPQSPLPTAGEGGPKDRVRGCSESARTF